MFSGWLFWALLAALTWGIGQVAAKKGLSHFSPLVYNFLSVLFDLAFFLPAAFFLRFDLTRLTLLSVIIAVFITATYLLYFYVIAAAPVSLSGTVLSTYSLSTMFFSVLFLGEVLTVFQLLFALMIIMGVVLIGWPEKIEGSLLKPWFFLAVLSAVLIGFADFLAKYLIGKIGLANYFLLYGPAFIPSMIMISPVASSYTAVTVVLALIFLKERLSRLQLVGVSMAVAGVVLIGA